MKFKFLHISEIITGEELGNIYSFETHELVTYNDLSLIEKKFRLGILLRSYANHAYQTYNGHPIKDVINFMREDIKRKEKDLQVGTLFGEEM